MWRVQSQLGICVLTSETSSPPGLASQLLAEFLAGRKNERGCSQISLNLLWKASLELCVHCLISVPGMILLQK